MTFNFKSYVRSLLSESIDSSEESIEYSESSSEDALLGKYAFAPARINAGDDSIPNEPNTHYEDVLYSMLRDHVRSFQTPLGPEHIENIKNFIETGQYKKVFFNPPPGTPIYRGMMISQKRLKRILGLGAEDIPTPYGKKEVNYVLQDVRKRGFGVSWSTDYNEAKGFSAEEYWDPASKQRDCKVIFTAAPGQEHKFLQFNPNPELGKKSGIYYALAGFNQHEDEVMAMDEIQVSSVEWRVGSSKSVGFDEIIASKLGFKS